MKNNGNATVPATVGLIMAFCWCLVVGEIHISAVFIFIGIFLLFFLLANVEDMATNRKLAASDRDKDTRMFEQTFRTHSDQESSEGNVYYGSYVGGHKGFPFPAKVGLAFLAECVRIKSIKGERAIDIPISYSSISNFEIVTPNHPYVMNLNVAGVLTNALAAASAAAKRMLTIEFNDSLGFPNGVLIGVLTNTTPEQLSAVLYRKISEIRSQASSNKPSSELLNSSNETESSKKKDLAEDHRRSAHGVRLEPNDGTVQVVLSQVDATRVTPSIRPQQRAALD